MGIWPFSGGSKAEKATKSLAHLEERGYESLEALIVHLKEDTGGVKSASYVDKLLIEVLREIEQEEAALGIIAGNAESFAFIHKVQLSGKWGADKRWGDVGNELTGDIWSIFKRKRQWINDLREKWKGAGLSPRMKAELTIAYAEQLQRIAKALFKVLERLRKESFGDYAVFKSAILDPIHSIYLGMDDGKRGAIETLAERRAS